MVCFIEKLFRRAERLFAEGGWSAHGILPPLTDGCAMLFVPRATSCTPYKLHDCHGPLVAITLSRYSSGFRSPPKEITNLENRPSVPGAL
jgi:hypothetical protein